MSPSNKTRIPLLHTSDVTPAPVSVYYETFAPTGPTKPQTVVMIHGGAHSGACYQRTADGRPGWAYDVAACGYRVAVPDWPGVGRSGHVPLDAMSGELVVAGLSGLIDELESPIVLMTHSMSGCYGWRLAELHAGRIAAVVGIAPSPPGNIQPEARVVSESDAVLDIETFGRPMRIDKLAPNFPTRETVLQKYIGNSRFFPRERIDNYIASLLGLPPRILTERRNVRGGQVRVRNPESLRGLPVLVMTGSEDIDHPRDVDGAIVDWLNSCGAVAEFHYLPDRGIAGNGHMMMLEENSSALAGIVLDWLDRLPADRQGRG